MSELDDSRWMLEQFLKREIQDAKLSDQVKEEMTYALYKNYYAYEMDEEFAARDAVSCALKKHHIQAPGFQIWIA